MGFPQWTIWGMAICLLLALIVLGYSLNVQSPRRGAGFQLEPYRREARVRALTVSAFALLLVMVGFFVAGVPVGNEAEPVAQAAPTQASGIVLEPLPSASPEPVQTPISGAFGQALVQDDEEVEEATEEVAAVVDESADSEVDNSAENPAPIEPTESEPTEAPTETPVPATETPSPTNTPSPTPSLTPSPTPTLTPTPINGETARVNTSGSTLWVKRSPGGQNMVILQDGDLLILLPGNANQAGLAWKQVKTVDGVEGWVERQYIAFGDDATVEESP